MHSHHHPGLRRGPRLARFLTALAFFAATTAGLHALSDHYGWQSHHGGSHSLGWGGACADTPAGPSKPAL